MDLQLFEKTKKTGVCHTQGWGVVGDLRLEGKNGFSSPPCLLTLCQDLAWWEADRCVLDTRFGKGLTVRR